MRYVTALAAAYAIGLSPAALEAQAAIKGGVSFGDVSNSGVLPGDVEGRTGFTIGLSLFSPGPIGIGLEVFYSERGVTGREAPASRELEYIDVPLLLRAAIPTGSVAPYAFAGPQISYELDCSSGDESCPDSGRPQWPTAGVIGAGIAFGENMNFSIEGRYVYGLSDLDLETITTSESYEDRSFMILGAIGF
ncbi:MAG TPA: porin family protein [Longimicrobiales bacterium]|nr:porin family protein [Longimicrobiales bacterium]